MGVSTETDSFRDGFLDGPELGGWTSPKKCLGHAITRSTYICMYGATSANQVWGPHKWKWNQSTQKKTKEKDTHIIHYIHTYITYIHTYIHYIHTYIHT